MESRQCIDTLCVTIEKNKAIVAAADGHALFGDVSIGSADTHHHS